MISHRKHHLQHNQLKSKISRKMGRWALLFCFVWGLHHHQQVWLTLSSIKTDRPKYSTNLNKGSTDPLRTFQWTLQRLKCPMFHSLFSKTDNVLGVKQWLNDVNTSLPLFPNEAQLCPITFIWARKKKKKNTFLLGLTVILDTCLLSFCFLISFLY